MIYLYRIIMPGEDRVTNLEDLPQEEQDRIKEQLSQRIADEIAIIQARS